MKRIKVIIAAFLMLAMTVCMFAALGGEKAQAATKPAKAKVTAKANDDGTSVTLTIAKTKKAQGYQIMVKKPGAKKFTKLATISEDGTAKRTYTAEKLTEGEYQFKVRAYLKNGKKTVWGKYSKVAKVKVEKPASDDKKDEKKDDNTGSGTSNVDGVTLDTFVGKYQFMIPGEWFSWDGPLGTWEFAKTDNGYVLKDIVNVEEHTKVDYDNNKTVKYYESVEYGKDIEISEKDVKYNEYFDEYEGKNIVQEWHLVYEKDGIHLDFYDYKYYTTKYNLDPELWGDSIFIKLICDEFGSISYELIE